MTVPPDWVTLRIFLAALELGSVTRAADRCGIATSAAAKRIQDLETDSGVLLLERRSRGVRPTPAGKVLARHARALLDLAAQPGPAGRKAAISPGRRSILSTSPACSSSACTICRAYSSSITERPSTAASSSR